jgi:folate-binding protein YgfZ
MPNASHAALRTASADAPTCAALDDWRVLVASGEDAIGFLHGQVTQDLAGLPADRACLAGYCTAKGRLLATLVAWRAADGAPDDARLYALVRADLAEALVKRLSMFVLRAKVKLAVSPLRAAGVQCLPAQVEALQAAAGGAPPVQSWQRVDLPSGTWIAAPAASGLRWWWVAGEAQVEGAQALSSLLAKGDAQSWREADLAAGLPWIGSATQDLFIPQTVNLDLSGGVSFNKGCYPGQEVVARSHYRGTLKRRMAYGHLADASASARPGEDVFDSAHPGEPSGRVVDAAGNALLFETALASLPAGDLHLGTPQGPGIRLAPLPYALPELGEKAGA